MINGDAATTDASHIARVAHRPPPVRFVPRAFIRRGITAWLVVAGVLLGGAPLSTVVYSVLSRFLKNASW